MAKLAYIWSIALLIMLFSAFAYAPPDLSVRNVDKTMLVKDDPLYSCDVMGNSVVTRERLDVLDMISGKPIPTKGMTKINQNAAPHIRNTYSMLMGETVRCGDACDIIYRGYKPLVEMTPVGEVITSELYQKRGETMIEPTYDVTMEIGVMLEDGTACSEWDFVNIDANMTDGDILVMRLNASYPFWVDIDAKTADMLKDDDLVKIDLSVMERTCWNDGTSCIEVYDYMKISETEWDVYMRPTGGWYGFDTNVVIDPLIWVQTAGEVSTTSTAWQDRIITTLWPAEGGIYSVFGYIKQRAGGGAKDKMLPTRLMLDSTTHSGQNYTAIEDDINKEYGSALSFHTDYLDESPHLAQLQYAAGEAGKTAIYGNGSIASIDPLTTTYLDDDTVRNVGTTNILVRHYNFTLSQARNGTVVVAFDMGAQGTNYLTVETYIDGSLYGNISQEGKIAGTYSTRVDWYNKEWSAGFHSVELRAVSSLSGKVKDIRVTPQFETDTLRIDSYSARSTTLTTSTTPINKISDTFIAEGGKSYLLVASALAGIAPSKTVEVTLAIDGVTVCTDRIMTRKGDDTGARQFGCLANLSYATTDAHAITLSFNRVAAGAENARIREAEILIYSPVEPVIPENVTGNVTGNVSAEQALADALGEFNDKVDDLYLVIPGIGLIAAWIITGIPVLGIIAAIVDMIVVYEVVVPTSVPVAIGMFCALIFVFILSIERLRSP